MALSKDAVRLLTTPNAGSNSIVSEVLSCELLIKYLGAELIKTEMEIVYSPSGGPITDYVIQCNQKTSNFAQPLVIAVSVTRAMTAPGRQYTIEMARQLLRKKLIGILYSTKNCQGLWTRQIPHVWSPNTENSSLVKCVYNSLLDGGYSHILGNTVVLLTTATNRSEIFVNQSADNPLRTRVSMRSKNNVHSLAVRRPHLSHFLKPNFFSLLVMLFLMSWRLFILNLHNLLEEPNEPCIIVFPQLLPLFC
ncbi:unnamed protein product [Calicophoron daubneyi]|uniref:Uncharacterized protein n=1 Tax=Calicophoron daubneyi TaxID=300641 RepID=A0AAV2TX42_CALDB